MRIGGLQKVSLIDYPGNISAVIFTQGCNFRCPYCHNPELVEPTLWCSPLSEEEVLAFLDRRVGKLDAVVISGGEPLLHGDLPSLLERIRAKGFLIKLDTNGAFPEELNALIQQRCLDYVALDVKAPWSIYPELVGIPVDVTRVQESVSILLQSTVDYELRTTVVRPLLGDDEVQEIGRQVRGAKRLVLQRYRAPNHAITRVDELYPPRDDELMQLKAALTEIIPQVIVRT